MDDHESLPAVLYFIPFLYTNDDVPFPLIWNDAPARNDTRNRVQLRDRGFKGLYLPSHLTDPRLPLSEPLTSETLATPSLTVWSPDSSFVPEKGNRPSGGSTMNDYIDCPARRALYSCV